jgi:ribose-phosphate pyrophosphokinase
MDLRPTLLGFAENDTQARQLADALAYPYARVAVHRFPDGESKVTLPVDIPQRVVFCRSLDRPNDKLVELLLATETARTMGARHVTLVAPYLCYMRQDIAFNPGEAVSQRILGRFLAGLFDAVITVDPHLHRIHHLNEAMPRIHAKAVSCAPLIGAFLRAHTPLLPPLLVGPDSESEQWARAVAIPAGLDYVVATKERLGDHEVRITLPERDYAEREVVLVDDMASTGRTMVGVATALRERGARTIECFVTHALHDAEATRLMHDAGIDRIWSSDSITHPSNAVSLTPLLAAALAAVD